jgi:hypothetical protein
MSDLTDTWRGRITDIGRMDSDTYFSASRTLHRQFGST